MASAPAKRGDENSSEATSEDHEARARRSPSGSVVYKSVLKEAEEELRRPTSALFWSGLAAGLSMGFSLAGEGLLRRWSVHPTITPEPRDSYCYAITR